MVPTCIAPKTAFNADAKGGQGLSSEEKAAGTRRAGERFPGWAGKGRGAETQVAAGSLQKPRCKSPAPPWESRTWGCPLLTPLPPPARPARPSQSGQGPPKPQRYPQILDAGGRAHPASPALTLQAAKLPFPPGEGSRLKILSSSSTDPHHAVFVSNRFS